MSGELIYDICVMTVDLVRICCSYYVRISKSPVVRIGSVETDPILLTDDRADIHNGTSDIIENYDVKIIGVMGSGLLRLRAEA